MVAYVQESGLDLVLVPEGGEQVSLHQVSTTALAMELMVTQAVMSPPQVMVVARSPLVRALAAPGAPLTLQPDFIQRLFWIRNKI